MNLNCGLLSICCLGYNHAKYIPDSLKAIWKCDYKNIEIIALDDGSKDESEKILHSLKDKSPFPMEVIVQDNTGNIARNLNLLLKKAKGEFVILISFDDVLLPERINECIQIMIKNQNIGFVTSSKIYEIDCEGKEIKSNAKLKIDEMLKPTIKDLLYLEYSDLVSFYVQSTVFRKNLIELVDGFDEDMTADDIVLRTKIFNYIDTYNSFGYEIVRFPICCYRKHDKNISSNSIRQLKSVTEYLSRYWAEYENPKILEQWANNAIADLNFKDSLNVFSMNSRTASLLSCPKIQNALAKKIKCESLLFSCIFYLEKKFKFLLKMILKKLC